MIHGVVFMITRAIYRSEYLVDSSLLMRVCYVLVDLLVVIVAAHVLYTKVEEPARDLILDRFLR